MIRARIFGCNKRVRARYVINNVNDNNMSNEQQRQQQQRQQTTETRRRLREYSQTNEYVSNENERKRAAVLVVLFENAETKKLNVVLTKRAKTMNSHANQVAFPGGKMDEEDLTEVDCAFREALEEIGLPREYCEVKCLLPPIVSAGFISVRPVVCIVKDYERFYTCEKWLRNNPREVQRTFAVPLDVFLKNDKEIYSYDDHAWENAPCAIRVHSFKVIEEDLLASSTSSSSSSSSISHGSKEKKNRAVVWGLTAAILIETAKIVFSREPEFERDCTIGASIWDLVGNSEGSGVKLRPKFVSKM